MNLEGVEIADRKGSLDLGGIRNDIPIVTFWRNGVQNADFALINGTLVKARGVVLAPPLWWL